MTQPIDYNQISQIYDDVRRSHDDLIDLLISGAMLNAESRILDIGCGTGNYTRMLQARLQTTIYGVEPSDGMREQAQAKNPHLDVRAGHAGQIPYEEDFFDFAYMTDVIHHVPDLSAMFVEVARVLKSDGMICIVTQSHPQIEKRPITKFFPETIIADKKRYPTIEHIIDSARHFDLMHLDTWQEGQDVELGADFLELVRKKGYSMLHLIPEEAYQRGLKQLEDTLEHGTIHAQKAGYTLVWLRVKSLAG